jgi:N-acetylated-alpha-linked acidic dipeptidase
MMTDQISQLRTAVSAPEMIRHLEEFARRIKLSGTPEELESFHYLRARLDEYGYRTDLISHPAYISLPGAARLNVGNVAPRCITHSFSRSSPTGGTAGRLVYAATGTAGDLAKVDAHGAILLLDGMATPGAAHRVARTGAIGQLHISPHEHIHEMCVSPVWGSPTLDSVDMLPSTVVLSIEKADGDQLKARLAAGESLEAELHAEVDTGWRETPILVAELMPFGAREDTPFVMFSGHHDTWYYGVMDNGGANATMLEVARLIAPHREQWRRGLRLCFWSGHSHGRYSGSTWYADNHWLELEKRCAVHVNVDSTGAKGNTVLTDTPSSSELVAFAREAISTEGGQELAGLRMGRAGDQSFWGVGVPSMFMAMGEQPASQDANVAAAVFGGGTRKGAGLGWWWHTPHDTLDKMDPDLLVRDTRIYVHTIWRLLTERTLPLDYADHASALLDVLTPLADGLAGRFDLSGLVHLAEQLRDAAEAFRAASPIRDASTVDRALMKVGRALVPLDYTTGDRFGHDPALPQTAWPALAPLRELVVVKPRSDAAAFLTVAARRAYNRLAHALEQAIAALSLSDQPSGPV